MSALEIRNIRKRYGEVETLKGIDIALESGEFLVLLVPPAAASPRCSTSLPGLPNRAAATS